MPCRKRGISNEIQEYFRLEN